MAIPARPQIDDQNSAPDTLIPGDYPQLKLLAWNRNPASPMTHTDAFALYEREWRHIDHEKLTDRELNLIKTLTKTCGKGHLLEAK